MVDQVLYFASWVRYRLQDRLGQRGAEMVEYAIVIACIAAVGLAYYSVTATYDTSQTAHEGTTLKSALALLFKKINLKIDAM